MKHSKTPDQSWSGVFASIHFIFCCLILAGVPLISHAGSLGQGFVESDCAAQGELLWTELDDVIDGDTLRLKDGRKVRVIAINSPELAYKKKGKLIRSAQPLANQARAAVEHFFSKNKIIGLKLGTDNHDRYGRLLAHVYREDGANLSAYLLAKGLAWQVVVLPNTFNWQCYQSVEKKASHQKLGVWSLSAYTTKSAYDLSLKDVGFQRVQGVVSSVKRSRDSWWLQVGKLAVRINDKNMVYFPQQNPRLWLNKKIVLRGWIINRISNKQVKRQGFSPLLLNLQHPVMIK